MPLPIFSNIEMPILQELSAVGGQDHVRFLYDRLISYFPQLSNSEIQKIKSGTNKSWRSAVQKAGKNLDHQNLIRRERGFWILTAAGKTAAAAEMDGVVFYETENAPLTHQDAQQILIEIGEILGYYAEREFEFYDVVWREKKQSQRLSHVFEVQSKGNLDSAFAKLKRAFDAQRSHPFLVLASERDTRRALQALDREFRELHDVVTILSFVELKKIHDNLGAIRTFLPKFLKV